MAVFKCKMCGGALDIQNSESVVTCEYCGTQQTLPKLDDDRRVDLYDRANHFRRNNEYDKAMGIYELILNEDKTDAEAYWSLVLCRYGIEYVKDPYSNKRIPTVNRAQFTSIYDDDNYKLALQYADLAQKSIYEQEAKAINEIQKGILEISQKEEPFDVFICYKETGADGRRTQDSVYAAEIYQQLTREGLKVFFSRITLEDKMGVAYEPYIFAALNSAKVMLVVGTQPEYFNAVWVKNEWSRYLALIKNGERKTLIPIYRDMSPYELPDEFSHLQAQDLSRIGFMQDLVRGVQKIVGVEKTQATVVQQTVVAEGGTNTAPMLERMYMCLEDGEWEKADEVAENLLNQEPKNAQGYLGKLLAELQVEKKEALKNCAQPFDGNINYQKVLRFGEEDLQKELVGCIEYIKERNENARLDGIYTRAKEKMLSASTEMRYVEAASIFETISHYQDAASLASECREKAEIVRKDSVLERGKTQMKGQKVLNYEAAIKLFETIPGWNDADDKIQECKDKIEELKAKEEAERLERERQEEIERQEEERIAKRNKKIATIAAASICAIIAFIVVLNKVIIPNNKYNKAVALMEAGKYDEALESFQELGDYKDSIEQATKNKYNKAVALMEKGNLIEAYEAMKALDGYKDSEAKAESIFEEYMDEKLKAAKVGDYVFIGAYEQDGDISNGKEEIEWLVLEVKDGKALLISKYALDCQQYNEVNEDVTWETCSLRTWLNDEFIDEAFSADEKEMIPTVTVSADENPEYDTDPGKETQDKVFLLSITEAEKYFETDSERVCEATTYAENQGASVSNSKYRWWLRSPGYNQDYAAGVFSGGLIFDYGNHVFYEDLAVRPALWINLNP